MAKPTIVTRAGAGRALTHVEADANFTNLQNATISVTDGTNTTAVDLNGTVTLIPFIFFFLTCEINFSNSFSFNFCFSQIA